MTRPVFRYDELPEEQARWLKDQAKQISTQLRHSAAAVLDIGKRLIEAEQILGDSFPFWVHAEFKWKLSTVRHYMACAKRFGHLDFAWVIQPTALILLSRKYVPESAIQEVLEVAKSRRTVSMQMAEDIISKHRIARFEMTDHPEPKRTATRYELTLCKRRFIKTLDRFQKLFSDIAERAMSDSERDGLARTLRQLATLISDDMPMDRRTNQMAELCGANNRTTF